MLLKDDRFLRFCEEMRSDMAAALRRRWHA
jgi:hypothetical protein